MLIVPKDITIYEDERVLEEDYPVYSTYLYVFDSVDGQYMGAVWRNMLQERRSTVKLLIEDIEASLNTKVKHVKNCSIFKRNLHNKMV
jgi:hypothetical protein